MKKFLIFLVAIVVVVSFGLTIFYFVRNDEVINFTTKEIYCNVGDVIDKSELGLTVYKRNKKTKYNYNAGGEEVTKLVEFDDAHGQYKINTEVGGDVNLVITTSNKKCPKFEIVLHIGDGSKTNPYNIMNQDQLENIGKKYSIDGNYILRKDISLNANFAPIALFNGYFDGNNKVISNLTLNGAGNAAGLFAKIDSVGTQATVADLGLENVSISGDYQFAGALAGEVNNATISCVYAKNVTILSSNANSIVGGLIGSVDLSKNISSCYVENASLKSDSIVGGLVGRLNLSVLQATYAVAEINTTDSNNRAGALVGEFTIGSSQGSIQQSYAYLTNETGKVATFVGAITKSANFFGGDDDRLYLVGNYAVGEVAKSISVKPQQMFDTLSNPDSSDYKITSIDPVTVENNTVTPSTFVFFAIKQVPTYWKDTNAWYTTSGKLPNLKMVKEFKGLSAEFVNKTTDEENIVGSESKSEDDNIADLKQKLTHPITDSRLDLLENYTYDFSKDTSLLIDPQQLANVTIYGNNATIKGLKVNQCLFSKLDNCTIKDINFEDLVIVGNAKGLFGEVGSSNYYSSSSISNIKISFSKDTNNIITKLNNEFGGIAAVLKNSTTVEGCSVENLTVNAVATTATNGAYVGGLVGKIESGLLNNCTANFDLNGAKYIGGLVGENNGVIANCKTIDTNGVNIINTDKALNVGGLVAINNQVIENSNSTAKIIISSKTLEDAKIGGIAAENGADGHIENVKFSGEGITLNQNIGDLNTVNIGGIVANNFGEMINVYNKAISNGSFNLSNNVNIANRNFIVGGIACYNGGTISKAVVNANLYGNVVAGAVVEINGTMDQVYIGKDADISQILYGDKFIAGVAYQMNGNAKISNVQTASVIEGRSTDTISSLILLIFPNGTTFENALINNEARGLGTLYTETWTNYNGSSNNYNLFGNSAASGSFTSVVINNTHIASTLSKKSSFFSWWNPFGTNYGTQKPLNQNFFRYVNDDEMALSSTYQGTYTLVANGTNSSIDGGNVWWRWVTSKYERKWTFDGSIWNLTEGIGLQFLKNLEA